MPPTQVFALSASPTPVPRPQAQGQVPLALLRRNGRGAGAHSRRIAGAPLLLCDCSRGNVSAWRKPRREGDREAH